MTGYVTEIRARELKAGDVVTAEGYIPLPITSVRTYDPQGFTVAAYECVAGIGSRTYAAGQRLTVIRADQEASH